MAGALESIGGGRRCASRALRAAWLGSSALIALSSVALAQDVNWLAAPADNNFNNGANYNGGQSPTQTSGRAIFDTSNTTNLVLGADADIPGIVLNAGANNYTLTIANHQLTLEDNFAGAPFGIKINGGSLAIQVSALNGLILDENLGKTVTSDSAAITVNSGGNLAYLGSTTNAGTSTIVNRSTTTGAFGSAGVVFAFGASAASATISNEAGGTVYFRETSTAANATITNKAGSTLILSDNSTAGAAIITTKSGGLVTFLSLASGGSSRQVIEAGGTVDISGSATSGVNVGSIEGAGTINVGSKRLGVGNNNLSTTFSGVVTDSGNGGTLGLIKAGTGTLTLTGASTYSSRTTINGGLLQLGNGGTTGSILSASPVTIASTNNATLAFNRSDAVTFGNSITGPGRVQQIGSGTTTLTGTLTYTGSTTINGGMLAVNSDGHTSSGFTVNSGGALGGTGTVSSVTVNNGGALAPGNTLGTLNVSGNVTFNAGSFYRIGVSPTAAASANVTGTANLAGAAVQATFQTGGYTARTYTIFTAAGGLGGTQFSGLSTFGFAVRNPRLTYDANNVYLTIDASGVQTASDASGNQNAVGNAINAAILNGATPSGGFNTLLNLSGGALNNALTQLSGETATGAQQSTFNAMTMFMGQLIDPFVAGRDDAATPVSGGSGVTAYAPAETRANTAMDKARDAFAAVPPSNAAGFGQRWGVWGAGFGGTQTTSGNAASGASASSSRIYGSVAGADYRLSPDTRLGFALAGGATSFNVANGGSGRADLFQAGLFARHRIGAAYVAGALAYGWQDVTTDRTVTVSGADRLQARFNASTISARLESGYRVATPWAGLTPYAAVQIAALRLPAYAEYAQSGTNTFALSYSAKTITATRGELGLRADKSWAVRNALLTLRGRAAWAHDFVADRAVVATFQSLPGASFTVNGAAQARDAALASASAELSWRNGFAVAATFDGEFSRVTQSYAGKGTVRYAW